MEFKQTAFLKPYIECNTELWKHTKNATKSKHQNAKSTNNAIFSESTENSMNKVTVKIVTNRKNHLNWPLDQPLKEKSNLIMIEKDKSGIKLNKPTHKEASILELSKVLMYDFHCNYIKNDMVMNLN